MHAQHTFNSAETTIPNGILKRVTIFRFLLAIAMFGWLYVIFFSDLFQVNRVEAVGITSMDTIEVKREVLAALDARPGFDPLKRHMFFVNEQKLAEDLKERFFAENVVVDKVGFNVLRLLVEERSNRVIIHTGTQFYWVDLNGVVTAELSSEEKKLALQRIFSKRTLRPSDPPIFEFGSSDEISIGFKIADSDQVKQWIRIVSQCVKQNLLYRVFYPNQLALDPVKIIDSEGRTVLMDTQESIQRQIEAYKRFIQYKPKDMQVSIVDVRIAGKIFAQ